jgi:hopene-associated glycosyltransferase HpnB
MGRKHDTVSVSFGVSLLIGAASLGTWIYLLFGRGGFWRVREEPSPASSVSFKSVVVIVPARNEEAVIGRAVASLLNQDYAGHIHVFVVDDHSSDATASAAGIHERLTIVQAGPLPPGWTGKLWAISQGLGHALMLNPDFILLTDADIVHEPDNVAGLVARAETNNLDLASYMVKLQCRTFPERALIPAFVYFFFQLYPPSWSMSAAGGCILIRPDALALIGGIASIRGELIDDCALARAVRKDGNIWIGVTQTTRSIRDYNTFAEIRRMISRTAFTQLRHSTVLLFATILGMLVIYLAPPLLILSADAPAALCGLLAWAAMTISYIPTLRFYGRSMAWAPLLPLIALFYIFATVDSAVRYWTGRGGVWKDRAQDIRRV